MRQAIAIPFLLLVAASPPDGKFFCILELDRSLFEKCHSSFERIISGRERFEPPVSNLLFDDFGALADPLEILVPNVDGTTGFGLTMR